jgi:hypothetical protein
MVSVELYNRPSETGRSHGVVILLHHALEMILKAIILKERGRIRGSREAYNYGFKKCVSIAETDIRVLTRPEAAELRALDHHRDAATHDVLVIPEDLLYFTIHGGVQLANALTTRAFELDLLASLPRRALPIASSVPQDLNSVLRKNIDLARELMTGRRRKAQEAASIVRTIANIEAALAGQTERPADREIAGLLRKIRSGADISSIFPAVSGLLMADPSTTGNAIFVGVRISKEGMPVRIAAEGEVADIVKPVNDFDIWPYTSEGLGKRVGVTAQRARALAHHLGLKDSLTYYKLVRHPDGKMRGRYSPLAAQLMREQVDKLDVNAIWHDYYTSGGR